MWFFWIIAIAAIVSNPIMTIVIVAAIIIFNLVAENKTVKENQRVIDFAVEDIEKVYEFATDYSTGQSLLPKKIVLSDEGSGEYKILLFVRVTSKELLQDKIEKANVYFGDFIAWSDGSTLYKYGTGSYKCKWDEFERYVWQAVRKKHPSWKIMCDEVGNCITF